MLKGFENLTSAEQEALLLAPVWITALLGAADGTFDREERNWSDRLVQVRTYGNPASLRDFYRLVADNFIEKVERKLAELPDDVARRQADIAAALEKLNPLLAKLDPALGAALYKSFTGLAAETAKASGGFLRMGAISDAEHRWVKLPMLTPIVPPAGELPPEEAEE